MEGKASTQVPRHDIGRNPHVALTPRCQDCKPPILFLTHYCGLTQSFQHISLQHPPNHTQQPPNRSASLLPDFLVLLENGFDLLCAQLHSSQAVCETLTQVTLSPSLLAHWFIREPRSLSVGRKKIHVSKELMTANVINVSSKHG